MAKITDVTINGKNDSWSFEVYPSDETFDAVGAVYIFTKRTVNDSGEGSHSALYIGETGSLADRIPNHQKWPCVEQNGVNCICTHQDDSEDSRLNKEADLFAVYRTPCND